MLGIAALGCGTPTSLIAMVPVLPGRETKLIEALEGIERDPVSPFASVPSTHFARFTYLPALPDGDREPVSSQAYLILAADFDGSLRRWLSQASQGVPGDDRRGSRHVPGISRQP